MSVAWSSQLDWTTLLLSLALFLCFFLSLSCGRDALFDSCGFTFDYARTVHGGLRSPSLSLSLYGVAFCVLFSFFLPVVFSHFCFIGWCGGKGSGSQSRGCVEHYQRRGVTG